jgi:excinuclease ABC subunit A
MYIEIKGAKENNLKNIDVKIPKNKLVVFTGISGSGLDMAQKDALEMLKILDSMMDGIG